MGAPRTYDRDQVFLEICEDIAQGNSLHTACARAGRPDISTVMRWLDQDERDNGPMREQYARSKSLGSEKLADELVEIADETAVKAVYNGEEVSLALDNVAVQRNRLRIDTRKWVLSKLAPKKYGDRTSTEISGPNGGPVQVQGVEWSVKG